MIPKLQYFLTIDDAARQRSTLISAAAGFLSGMLLQWYGNPFDVSAYFSVAVASGVFTLRTLLYCRTAKARLLTEPVVERRRVLRFAAVAAAVFLLSVLPARRVEAGVLDRRLRALTPGPSLTPDAPEKITDTMELAQRWGVSIPSTTLVRVRDAIKASAVSTPNLDALPPAANALTEYGRSIAPLPTPRGVEALAEVSLGSQLMRDAAIAHPAVDTNAAKAAVAAYSRAIQLSNGDRTIQSRALLGRASTYTLLGRFDDAYSDAKSAEALDSTDLPALVLIEGLTLATHTTQPSDLKQAAGLLALAEKMQAPPDLASDSKGMAVTTLAEVYYDLGNYNESRAAALRGLALAPPLMINALYQLLSVSFLRSGEYEEALRVAKEYSAKAGDSRSAEWLQLVSNYPTAPQASLDLLEGIRQPLRLTFPRS